MIAIDNNPHDAMKTERCVSILKKNTSIKYLPRHLFHNQQASFIIILNWNQ